MKLSDGILMAAKNIKARKLRSTLTIIAIAIGAMLLVITNCTGSNVNKSIDNLLLNVVQKNQVRIIPIKYDGNKYEAQAIQMQTQSGANLGLPYAKKESYDPKLNTDINNIDNGDLKKLRALKGVDGLWAYTMYSVPKVSIEGIKNSVENPTIIGNASGYNYEINGKVVAGKKLDGNPNEIMVSESFLNKLGIKDYNSVIGKAITLSTNGTEKNSYSYNGKIVGVYKSSEGQADGDLMTMDSIRMNFLSHIENIPLNNLKEYYQMVVLDGVNSNINTVNSIRHEVNQMGYFANTVQSSLAQFNEIGSVLKNILNIGAIIIIVVAAVGLTNTMAMSIQEQKKWIAIMRAVGATSRNIKSIFLAQGIILGTIGGILGCILASIAILGTSLYLNDSSLHYKVTFGVNDLFLGFIVTFIVAILSALIVTIRIRKINLINALNEE
ncbi:MAG: ABC transporter permease [Sarcina sp.]